MTDLGNSCSGSYAIALKLSGQTNSHAEQSSQTNYGNNACISVPAGSSVSVGYQTDNCDGFQTTLASISGTGITNAHVGNGDTYSTKICASVTTANISVSISDGIVTYGTLGQNATKSTLSGELNDMQTATNDGTVTETFNIRGQDSVNWTLGTTAGSDIYVHRFCNDTANDCTNPPTNYTALTTSNQTLATGVTTSGTINFQLQINTPNPSSVFTQQSVNVIIQAVQQ